MDAPLQRFNPVRVVSEFVTTPRVARGATLGLFERTPSAFSRHFVQCHGKNRMEKEEAGDANKLPPVVDWRCSRKTNWSPEPQDSECLMAFRRKVLRNSLRTLRTRCHYWVPRLSEGISPLERVMHFGTRPANSAQSAQLKDGAICRERRALYFAPYTPLAP